MTTQRKHIDLLCSSSKGTKSMKRQLQTVTYLQAKLFACGFTHIHRQTCSQYISTLIVRGHILHGHILKAKSCQVFAHSQTGLETPLRSSADYTPSLNPWPKASEAIEKDTGFSVAKKKRYGWEPGQEQGNSWDRYGDSSSATSACGKDGTQGRSEKKWTSHGALGPLPQWQAVRRSLPQNTMYRQTTAEMIRGRTGHMRWEKPSHNLGLHHACDGNLSSWQAQASGTNAWRQQAAFLFLRMGSITSVVTDELSLLEEEALRTIQERVNQTLERKGGSRWNPRKHSTRWISVGLVLRPRNCLVVRDLGGPKALNVLVDMMLEIACRLDEHGSIQPYIGKHISNYPTTS